MKHLEDNPPTAGGLKLGVVPISGVIVGYFYRYENELITVLDVWGGGSQPAAPAPHPNPSMIEQSLAAVTRNRAPSAIDASNLTDNAYVLRLCRRIYALLCYVHPLERHPSPLLVSIYSLF